MAGLRGGSECYQIVKHERCTPGRRMGRDVRDLAAQNHRRGWVRQITSRPLDERTTPPQGRLGRRGTRLPARRHAPESGPLRRVVHLGRSTCHAISGRGCLGKLHSTVLNVGSVARLHGAPLPSAHASVPVLAGEARRSLAEAGLHQGAAPAGALARALI